MSFVFKCPDLNKQNLEATRLLKFVLTFFITMSSHEGLFSAVLCLYSTPDLADRADDDRGWPADIMHRVEGFY